MFPRPAGAERNDIEDKDDSKNEKQKADNTNYALPPPNPDPCTGLFRLDLGRRLGDYDHAQGQGLVTGNMEDIVGLHGLKNDEVGVSFCFHLAIPPQKKDKAETKNKKKKNRIM